jgi:hypothetical protein
MSKSSSNSRAALCLGALLGLAAGACVYDGGQRCGPAMVFVETINTCVCGANAVAVVGGCEACPADEVPVGGTCGCAAGQTKNADHVCVVVAGFGDPCDTASSPCSGTTYSYCAVHGTGTAGSCTKTCTNNTDCDSAYTCATWDAQPSCRTFSGIGAACTVSSDCGGDANFCDTFVSHSCGIAGCSLTADDCPRGTLCCDFSGYGLGNLCAGTCL